MGTTGFPWNHGNPMRMGIGIPDYRYMEIGTGIEIWEWKYNNGNGNAFPKLTGNLMLFAQITGDVLAPLQYALGLIADAAITLTQFDIRD